ncbi:hypothetical protein BJ912DRAFT_951523, partial [Pholiota molesta]|jgi:hypothetical protein
MVTAFRVSGQHKSPSSLFRLSVIPCRRPLRTMHLSALDSHLRRTASERPTPTLHPTMSTKRAHRSPPRPSTQPAPSRQCMIAALSYQYVPTSLSTSPTLSRQQRRRVDTVLRDADEGLDTNVLDTHQLCHTHLPRARHRSSRALSNADRCRTVLHETGN